MSWLIRRIPQRSYTQELLDDADIPLCDLWHNLDDLRYLNRMLGTTRLVLGAIKQLWSAAGRPESLRILDIGTGAADIPTVVSRWGQQYRLRLNAIAVDHHRGVAQYACQAAQHEPHVVILQADGLHLPFTAGAFDIAVCSTMLHHLTWNQGVMLLRAMAEATRMGLIVNDLARHTVAYYGAKWFLPMVSRNRLTRNDGPLSVLRAYTIEEVRNMARVAGLTGVRIRSAIPYRWLLVYTHRAALG